MGRQARAEAVDCTKRPTLCQILKNKPEIDKPYADKLAKLINAECLDKNVSPKLYAAILMQESGYVLNTTNNNSGMSGKSVDFGIAQINERTAKSYGMDTERLLTDLKYSVSSGVKVLSWFKKMYERKEQYWFCRYNLGSRSLDKIIEKCLNYSKLVERWK